MQAELIIPVDTSKTWPFGSRTTDHHINVDQLSSHERDRIEKDAEIDLNLFSSEEDAAAMFARCRRTLVARHVRSVIRARDRLRAI